MLVDFTNHLGIIITDHLLTAIQFEYSGAVDKLLNSNIAYIFTKQAFLTREDYSNASIAFTYFLDGSQTKEIKMNDFGRDPAFIFTNHTGAQITNHLGEFIFFVPDNGVKTFYDLNSTAQLHRLIDSIITDSFSITADIAHHIIMNSAIEYSVLITGAQTKEQYLTAELLSTNDLNAILNLYRNLDAGINYSIDLNALIMKRIGWWDTLIIKFKE